MLTYAGISGGREHRKAPGGRDECAALNRERESMEEEMESRGNERVMASSRIALALLARIMPLLN